MSLRGAYKRAIDRQAIDQLDRLGWSSEDLAILTGLELRTVQRLRKRVREGRRRLRTLAKRSRPAEPRIPDAGCSGAELEALLAKFGD